MSADTVARMGHMPLLDTHARLSASMLGQVGITNQGMGEEDAPIRLTSEAPHRRVDSMVVHHTLPHTPPSWSWHTPRSSIGAGGGATTGAASCWDQGRWYWKAAMPSRRCWNRPPGKLQPAGGEVGIGHQRSCDSGDHMLDLAARHAGTADVGSRDGWLELHRCYKQCWNRLCGKL